MRLRKPRVMRLPKKERRAISRGDVAEVAVEEVAAAVASVMLRMARTTKDSR